MDNPLKIVGKPIIRQDSFQKTNGQAKYTADFYPKNTFFAVIVRSQKHHALIKSINVSKATQFEGVIKIITAADIPGEKTFGVFIQDQPALADGIVRHYGEPIVIVVANSIENAENAAQAVTIDYEEINPVFDPIQALEKSAPSIHQTGNLTSEYHILEGNPNEVFSEADIVVEEHYQVPRISPGYMEPEASFAIWKDEQLTVWVSSQEPFHDRHAIASVVGLAEENVIVKSAVIGGAFGGKEDSMISVLAGLAAYVVKGSVKIVNRRAESFYAHPKRHAAHLHYRISAKADGTLTGLEATVHLDTGAYASYGPAVGGLLTEMVPGAYFWPNVKIDTYIVYTNGPLAGAMRGFGSPQAHFALESILNTLAEKLNLDPIELRKKNLLKPGDQLATRVVAGDWVNSLPKISHHIQTSIRRLEKIPANKGKKAGVGFAFAMQSMGLGAKVQDHSTHKVTWLPSGDVLLYLGAPDIGQGLATISAQILAEVLEIPFHQIQVSELDTSIVLNGGVTCASRMTYLVGNAMITAGAQLKDNLIKSAAQLLNVPENSLKYADGKIITEEGQVLPAAEFTSRLAEMGSAVETTATATFPSDPEGTPQHLPIGMPHTLFVFGAQVARVEVDPELGSVEITDLVAIHDVGKIINPIGVEGQIEGGVATGIGYALYEDVSLKENNRWVDSFTEYLLVTSEDMPTNLTTIILEDPETSGPFGAKGIGEICLVATAPAITNAVTNATGIRITKLPVNPENLIS